MVILRICQYPISNDRVTTGPEPLVHFRAARKRRSRTSDARHCGVSFNISETAEWLRPSSRRTNGSGANTAEWTMAPSHFSGNLAGFVPGNFPVWIGAAAGCWLWLAFKHRRTSSGRSPEVTLPATRIFGRAANCTRSTDTEWAPAKILSLGSVTFNRSKSRTELMRSR